MKFFLKIYLISIFILTLAPMQVAAQGIEDPRNIEYGLSTNFSNVGIGQTDDLKGTIANIINIVLGFLGIVAVIIILFGGFKWMTAAGNEDQVSQARTMIVQGIIGLFVVFAAWAIASFVIGQLQSATSNGGTASTSTNQPANELVAAQSVDGTPDGSGNESGDSLPIEQSQTIDSDGDGLTDEEETNLYNSDPNNPDTDGDGYLDGEEATTGNNVLGSGTVVDGDACGALSSQLGDALGDASIQSQIETCCSDNPGSLLCTGS
jgi:hypothetical protein